MQEIFLTYCWKINKENAKNRRHISKWKQNYSNMWQGLFIRKGKSVCIKNAILAKHCEWCRNMRNKVSGSPGLTLGNQRVIALKVTIAKNKTHIHQRNVRIGSTHHHNSLTEEEECPLPTKSIIPQVLSFFYIQCLA